MKRCTARRRPCIAALSLAMVPALAGCALMGGGSDPPTMYRFGRAEPQATQVATVPNGPTPVLLYREASFERQGRGDRILTSTGGEVAYVAAARWIVPAPEMFDAAAIRSLEAVSPAVQVIRIGDRARPDYVMTVDVRRFEADYSSGSEAAPEIVVEARVKLMRAADRVIVGDWPIVQREPATENRVDAIVSAFDRATGTVTGQIADLAGTRMAAR